MLHPDMPGSGLELNDLLVYKLAQRDTFPPVSNLLQRVTQWISIFIFVRGKLENSSQVQVISCSTSPKMRRLQVAGLNRGTGP